MERHNGGLSFGKMAAHLLAMEMGQGQCCEAESFQHASVAKEPCPIFIKESNSVQTHTSSTSSVVSSTNTDNTKGQ